MQRSTHKGVALVIVLCLLVLISGIVVAFFSSVSSEYLTARSAYSGVSSKELADATVQVVMGQIRQATSTGTAVSTGSNLGVCWASQPGMIRTWGEADGNGVIRASYKKLAFYKLYSSGTMIVSGAGVDNFSPEDDVAADWYASPALYTDLNAPLAGSSGTSYPIVDPSAGDAVEGSSYPLVDGFSIDEGKAPIAKTTGSTSAPANKAPMPVKWVYMLRDGTLIAPDPESTGTVAQFTNAYAALGYGDSEIANNPIVGRVAFWTDDETCKLNLNTACGGAYWEQPMFTTDMDVAFSRYKPVAGEFNRFRGHPATTSLMPVFWSFAGLGTPSDNLFPDLQLSTGLHVMSYDVSPLLSTTGSTAFTNLMRLVPRNASGGSRMGTVATNGKSVTTGSNPIALDADRLYASVDEALFGNPTRGEDGIINAFSTSTHQLNNAALKKLRFFLTTTSRAPETNPFNQPKVGIWPVPEKTGTNYRSPADRLISFCSTLNGPDDAKFYYFFTRNNAQSGTSDMKAGSRNEQLFDFLDDRLANNIPGFGRSFKDRYTVEGDRHILINIYDYIRSTINILDTSFGSTAATAQGFKNFYNTFLDNAANFNSLGFGQVVPIKITKNSDGDSKTYKGMGRFPLIKQAAILFMARASNQPPLLCDGVGLPYMHATTTGSAGSSGTSVKFFDEQTSTWTDEGIKTVLKGEAFATANRYHLWTAAPFDSMTGNRPGLDPVEFDVPQLKAIDPTQAQTGAPKQEIDGETYFLPVLAIKAEPKDDPNNPPPVDENGRKIITDANNLFPVFGTFVRDVNDTHPKEDLNVGKITWREDQFAKKNANVTELKPGDPSSPSCVSTISPYVTGSVTLNSKFRKFYYVQPQENHAGDIMYPSLIGNDDLNGRYGIVMGKVRTVRIAGSGEGAPNQTYKFIQAEYSWSGSTSKVATLANAPQTHAGMPYLTIPSVSGTSAGTYTLPNPRYQGKDANTAFELPPRFQIPPGYTEMQAVFLIDPVNVAPGTTPLMPKITVSIEGLDSFIITTPGGGSGGLGFPSPAIQSSIRPVGGVASPFYNLGMSLISLGMDESPNAPRNTKGTNQKKLDFIGKHPVIVTKPTFDFHGGNLKIKVYATPLSAGASPTSADSTNVPNTSEENLVQTYTINFPSDGNFPTPALPHMPLGQAGAQNNNTLFAGPGNSGTNVIYNANNFTGLYGPIYKNGQKAFYWKNNPNAVVLNDDTVRFPPNVPSRIADLTPSSLLTPDTASTLSTPSGGKGGPNEGVGKFLLYITANNGMEYPTTNTVLKGQGYSYREGKSRFYYSNGNDMAMTSYFLPEQNARPNDNFRAKLTCDTIRSVECLYGDPRVFAGLTEVGPEFFKPHRYYHKSEIRAAHSFRGAQFGMYPESFKNMATNFRGGTDTSLSDAVLLSGSVWNYNVWTAAGGGGDFQYARRVGMDLSNRIEREISRLGGAVTDTPQKGTLVNYGPYTTSSSEFNDDLFEEAWPGITHFSDVWKKGGDFSNGVGSEPDGPYINKPNEAGGYGRIDGATVPLYPDWWVPSQSIAFTVENQFSPNRLISSPVAFGSLPAGFEPEKAWQTLLFCANPNASTSAEYKSIRMTDTDMTLANHKLEEATCPDHLLLDFFTMPVVEPYAISEPFSTGGKVNMNYQIAPFTYIKRDTALRGVLLNTFITAVKDGILPPAWGGDYGGCFYKSNLHGADPDSLVYATGTDTYGKFLNSTEGWAFRYPIHADETLKQFEWRFAKGDGNDIFRSPSEICSLFLYPAQQPQRTDRSRARTALVNYDINNNNILDWWYQGTGNERKSLTGDNERERPYDAIYPRLTTKSNSYTVHFRVQVLKKVKTTDVTQMSQWVEGRDQTVSEYRGSTLIERYIDMNDTTVPDFATYKGNDTLDNHYKFRVVTTKKFTAE